MNAGVKPLGRRVSYTYYTNGPRETMTDASGLTTYTFDLREPAERKGDTGRHVDWSSQDVVDSR